MGRGEQLIRQWSILHRLRQGRISRRCLAQEFSVSLKTITRDIDTLSLFPIIEEHEGIDVFYSLVEGSRTPGIWFNAEEVTALIFAKDMVLDTLDRTPYKASFETLLEKIERVQKGHSFRMSRKFPEVFQVFPSSRRNHRTLDSDLFQHVLDAALDMKCIRIQYFTVYRQTLTERVVEPFVVYQSPQGLRLIAYCRMRQKVLFFSMNQIREVVRLKDSFDLEARRFDLDTFLRESFDDMHSEPIVDVKLHIRFPTAHRMRSRNLHPTQVIRDVEDGIEISFRSGGLPAIAVRVMGIGVDCTVLEPPELRERVRKRAQAILQAHQP